MKIVLHCWYKTRHKGAVNASLMATLSYCMWEQCSTKTYPDDVHAIRRIFCATSHSLHWPVQNSGSSICKNIDLEKFSTSHAVPLNLWFIILLIKTKKSGLPGCKKKEKMLQHTFIWIIHLNLSSLKQISMFCPCFVIQHVELSGFHLSKFYCT